MAETARIHEKGVQAMTLERWWLCRRASGVDPQQVCRHDGCGWVLAIPEGTLGAMFGQLDYHAALSDLRELAPDAVLADAIRIVSAALDPDMEHTFNLLADLERWFHRLGSDDPKWWAKEIHAYLTLGDPLRGGR